MGYASDFTYDQLLRSPLQLRKEHFLPGSREVDASSALIVPLILSVEKISLYVESASSFSQKTTFPSIPWILL